ncbi:hypothetical protein MW887_011334 [Aspergillus wentii]|nr:hypothetical protein MW887_011334 [Aspergillus wentii]
MAFAERDAYAGLEASTIPLPHTENEDPEIPIIDDNETLVDVTGKFSNFITRAIPDVAYSFDQLRYSPQGQSLRLLVHSLVENSHNPLIISALMILKWQFDNSTDADWGLNQSRGYACEYVAWQFLCHLTQRETIGFLLEELPHSSRSSISIAQAEIGASGFASPMGGSGKQPEDESTPLLASNSSFSRFFGRGRNTDSGFVEGDQGTQDSYHEAYRLGRYSLFSGLNALEIATIAQAKSFLGQKVVQRVIDNIWRGEIVFWDTLSVHSKKKPHFFNKRTADPYSRLRVPVYRKAFEALFFVSFLFLYYAVLVERSQNEMGIFEILMYIWIVAFAYDEFSGMTDAGMLFYQMDFWSMWNLGIIGTGLAFVIASEWRMLCKSASPVPCVSASVVSGTLGQTDQLFRVAHPRK